MPGRALGFGEAVRHLHLKSNRNPRFATSSLGGRFVLVCVVADLASQATREALGLLAAARFDEGARVACMLCSCPSGEEDEQVRAISAKSLVFYDDDRAALEAWGLAPRFSHAGGWLLLDPTMRALAFWRLEEGRLALAALAGAPDASAHAGTPLHAPALIVPRIFEPAFCRELIAEFDRKDSAPSGTTKENEQGKTYVALDTQFKSRADCIIDEPSLRQGAMHRIYWRLLPEIEKAFMARMTRMERYVVACYDAASGGYFRPHRDNTTKGTAHRRFAVTINLNAEEYEGGDLRFPEFGARSYRAPTGGAIVFSCALLHEALPVTRGKRFAFLPFLYDEGAAKVRQENNAFLDDSIGAYEA
jgi:predicted 2-oxoglutarate/Fe(II)-dependent dioxygenase YbiX